MLQALVACQTSIRTSPISIRKNPRRTPYEFIKNLSMLKNHNLKLFTDLFDPVTYGNLLSESKMQIVTWDSISMVSEAISSETGTFLYEFEEESCPKRYQL